jgi:ATP-dependent Clp protease, protease subunit
LAEALDRMKAGIVAAYRDKSGREDAEIEALMQAETWLSAKEAVALGLADRVEAPVSMAARFDLSRFRNPPPQLVAMTPNPSPQENVMPDPESKRTSRAAPAAHVEQGPDAQAESGPGGAPLSQPEPGTERTDEVHTPDHQPTAGPGASAAAAQPSAQVIDLDAVRADERKAPLAYVAEVHELCAIACRGDLAAGFIAKATPVVQVRRALLEARAAEDEATAIRSQVRMPAVDTAQPAIDTAAIYAARNQNVR